jgi:two-component system, chemotaxis family, CheB/CheR fusion protein
VRGPELEKVLNFLHSRTSVDFTHYKMATIRRRLSRPTVLQRTETLKDYLALLEREPSEANALFDDLLITVTELFRDPETFRRPRREGISRLCLRIGLRATRFGYGFPVFR